MTESYKFIRYTIIDGIAEITLDRPPLKLIQRDMTLEYFAALEAADADPDVRAGRFAPGLRRAFCP